MKDIEISGKGFAKEFTEGFAKGFPKGFPFYRIPAITVSAKGTIIVAYECRISRDDWDTRAIGIRISRDGGVSFGQRIIAAEDEKLAVNNPVLCSLTDGRIILIYQKNYERTFVRISDDDGITFSSPKEITYCFEGFSSRHPFNVCAVGPGHATVTESGRIIVPVWLALNPQRQHWPSVSGTIYSDDRGESWKAGVIIDSDDELVSPSETSSCILSDGSVLLNLRHNGSCRRRALCISSDGATDHTCTPRKFCDDLADPVCFASMVNQTNSDRIFYCGCDSTDSRTNLTLKYSDNDGENWSIFRRLYDSAGYCDIAEYGGKIYCFFERDNLTALSLEIIGDTDA